MKTWYKIPRGSKITLEKDRNFNGFDGIFTLKAGQYYIVGFWANACGLTQNKDDIKAGMCNIHIPSISLRKFKEVS